MVIHSGTNRLITDYKYGDTPRDYDLSRTTSMVIHPGTNRLITDYRHDDTLRD
jgi:hypothetical protein